MRLECTKAASSAIGRSGPSAVGIRCRLPERPEVVECGRAAFGWPLGKADVAPLPRIVQLRCMKRPTRPKKSLSAAYLQAIIGIFLMLLAADWIVFAIWGKWLAWPFVIAIAVAWPIVMTAIT
jgi:hypothetical protein